MNGIERVDKPGHGFFWTFVIIVIGILAGVLIWHYRKTHEPEPQVSPQPSAEESVAVAEPAPEPLPVVEVETSAPAVAVAVTPTNQAAQAEPTNQVVQVQPPPAAALATEADALLADGKKDKARDQYLAALAAKPDEPLRLALEDKLGALNVELIRRPWPMAGKQEIIVQEGDSIRAIARKFGTTVELIVKGNDLKRPDVIRPGQRLKVFSAKMELVVDKSRNDLLLTAGGRYFKRYKVGTGRYDKTPVGTFVISDRIPEPPWWRDDGRTIPFGDKENILGTRWMAIKATGNTPDIKGYGIHGTWDTNTIGKAESAGCIRLRNEDVEELFELVPVGTPVIIEE